MGNPFAEYPQSLAREAPPLEAAISRLKHRLMRLRRRFPYLVWYDDELDVTITFREAKLPEFVFNPDQGFPAGALSYLSDGQMAQIERALADIGISFDKGGGACGRDWEWDFSLRGPVNVKFRSRATKPERRA